MQKCNLFATFTIPKLFYDNVPNFELPLEVKVEKFWFTKGTFFPLTAQVKPCVAYVSEIIQNRSFAGEQLYHVTYSVITSVPTICDKHVGRGDEVWCVER